MKEIEVKKVNLLGNSDKELLAKQKDSKKTEESKEDLEVIKAAAREKRAKQDEEAADEILKRYAEPEKVYQKIGAQRAIEDKERRKEWERLKSGYIKTSLLIPLTESECYEKIRKKARGTFRVGYRHIFSYGLQELMKMEDEKMVEELKNIDSYFKKQGLRLK